MRALLALAAVLAATACRSADTHAPPEEPVHLAEPGRAPLLRDEDVARWSAHLAPRPDEVAWRAIPWHATLAEGVAAARAAEKPLLLWVMNGHPLGCT